LAAGQIWIAQATVAALRFKQYLLRRAPPSTNRPQWRSAATKPGAIKKPWPGSRRARSGAT